MRSPSLSFVALLVFAAGCTDGPVGLEPEAHFLALALAAPTPAITTVAGDGTEGFTGDNGPAIDASLAFPTAVLSDGAGGFFITDQVNQRIRKVTGSGNITTVAGNGSIGSGGDGGPATSASFNFPLGLALDGAGNLLIADQHNHRIRMVDPSGTITTVAGNGTGGFSGDGGPATSASFLHLSDVAVDPAGGFLIADRNNQRVRRVDAAGMVSTVAGNGIQGFAGDGGPATSASLSSPVGIALDAAGNLYIADQLNSRVRMVDGSGVITTVAGNGTAGFGGDGGFATSAQLNFPLDVWVDALGNIFIADLRNNRIRKVDAAGTITTVAGDGVNGFGGDGGPATSASLARPRAVATDAFGQMFIADLFNHRIRRVGCTPKGLLEDLVQAIQDLALPGNGGQAQLNAALRALAKDPPDTQGAINSLQAFINFVSAQSGKKISVQDAEELIEAAQAIIDLLEGDLFGCS